MLKLNLPVYEFKIIRQKEALKIFDIYRKCYVKLTPEEWVRQNFLRYLTEVKKVPVSHIKTEGALHLNDLKKRTDAVVFDKEFVPAVLIEFKAPDVLLSEKVFEQINIYSMVVAARYVVVTNGMTHYYAKSGGSGQRVEFINDLPEYCNL
ncbi:MAG: hypothetical protein BWY70_01195 [Bacteroidetes bacterium ADurb.Bin408]|nr:MAG: hypothetical protein BWY70_01195 [Bacteroidetes bacterium ADurb.Bin408]